MRTIDLTDRKSETRILVTGGAGFIGTWLASRLLADGYEVNVLDDLSTGDAGNVERLSRHPSYRFHRGSVLDEALVDSLVASNDVIVHLAAAVGVRLIMEHPLESFTTNIRGSQLILEASHRYRRRVFLASTSEVYGRNSEDPLSESSDRILGAPSVTRWSYSTSKAVEEILGFGYFREHGLSVVIGRFFNTVGPGQSARYGMVIPRLVRQALAGEPLTVYGNGTQTRCFCHVRDTVTAIASLLFEPRANGDVFNIGSLEQVSMLELAELILELTGSTSRIQLLPYSEVFGEGFEDLPRRRPDTEKLRTLVGWDTTYDLRDILKEVIRHQSTPSLDRIAIGAW